MFLYYNNGTAEARIGVDPVVGLQWSRSSEQHGVNKHRRGSFGYAQDRLFDSAPQALCQGDKSVGRSAPTASRGRQDDDSVGELTEQRLLCGSRGAQQVPRLPQISCQKL